MVNSASELKKVLTDLIHNLTFSSSLYVKNPGKDFTRERNFIPFHSELFASNYQTAHMKRSLQILTKIFSHLKNLSNSMQCGGALKPHSDILNIRLAYSISMQRKQNLSIKRFFPDL